MSKLFKFLIRISLLSLIFLSACTSTSEQPDQSAVISDETAELTVEGELVEINSGELLIQQANGDQIRLNLTVQSIFWDGKQWMAAIPAEIGDRINAYGTWNEERTVFNVALYYANRVDLQGIVYYVCGETEAFMVDQSDQEYIILPLPQKTELLTESPTDPTSYKYFDLMPNFGEELQVVGREIEEPFLIAVTMTRMD
jgi:ABC-type Fe3+-hydroxamate transport system substrate-binding protein